MRLIVNFLNLADSVNKGVNKNNGITIEPLFTLVSLK